MIARHDGIAQSHQQLMFGDVILDDPLTLTDHSIAKESSHLRNA
jgi:hypothetical protein